MSLYPVTLNFNGRLNHGDPLYAGDTFSHSFTFVDEDNVAIDKSGSTFLSQIRDSLDNLIETFTVGVSGAGNNIVTISLSDAETALIDPGTYSWDLQETDTGVVTTLVKGEIIVEGDISRV